MSLNYDNAFALLENNKRVECQIKSYSSDDGLWDEVKLIQGYLTWVDTGEQLLRGYDEYNFREVINVPDRVLALERAVAALEKTVARLMSEKNS